MVSLLCGFAHRDPPPGYRIPLYPVGWARILFRGYHLRSLFLCSARGAISKFFCASPETAIQDTIKAAKDAGIDVDSWGVAGVMQAISGPAAEARAKSQDFYDVLSLVECETDLADAWGIASLVEWTDDQLENVVGNAAQHLDKVWADPKEWNALLLLAGSLPREGRIDGKICWQTYERALQIDVRSMPSVRQVRMPAATY